jgi:hypothetical protein
MNEKTPNGKYFLNSRKDNIQENTKNKNTVVTTIDVFSIE